MFVVELSKNTKILNFDQGRGTQKIIFIAIKILSCYYIFKEWKLEDKITSLNMRFVGKY
jgi:hypothetical protein